MYLILLKPKSVILPKKLFKNVIEKNKNGFGFMLLDKQKNIITYKTISKNWEEHYDAFAPYNNNDYEVGIHWRLKTQGDETLENTHPFEVKKPLGSRWPQPHPSYCKSCVETCFDPGNPQFSRAHKFFQLLQESKDHPTGASKRGGYWPP